MSAVPSPSTSAAVWLVRTDPGGDAGPHVPVLAGGVAGVGLVAAVVEGNVDGRSADEAGATVELGSRLLEHAEVMTSTPTATATVQPMRLRFIARSEWPDPTRDSARWRGATARTYRASG